MGGMAVGVSFFFAFLTVVPHSLQPPEGDQWQGIFAVL